MINRSLSNRYNFNSRKKYYVRPKVEATQESKIGLGPQRYIFTMSSHMQRYPQPQTFKTKTTRPQPKSKHWSHIGSDSLPSQDGMEDTAVKSTIINIIYNAWIIWIWKRIFWKWRSLRIGAVKLQQWYSKIPLCKVLKCACTNFKI